jgi:hypothetical protein
MKKQPILGLVCLLFVLAAAGFVVAQSATTGQIVGNVADPTGALVPNAKITLTGDNGIQRSAISDAAGHYAFALLPPGNYMIEVEANGFAVSKIDNIRVKITETTAVNASLKLKGAGEQTVEVTAAPPLVQADNATNGRVIEQSTIRQLPLPTRNFQQLLTLTPGTTGSLANSSELGRGDATVSVNGQRMTSNSIVINGIDAAAIGTGGTPNLAVPATDSMQEFVVQTSLYDASTGRNTGGVVAAVTRSGTDKFHGNVYEFLRSDALNANNFFLKREGIARPTYERNQFGGTFGGPIKKNKAWFFLSYQGTRETNGTSLLNSLSTVAVPGTLTNDRSTAALTALSAQLGMYGIVNPVAATIFNAKLPNGQYLIPSATAGGTSATSVPVTIPATSTFQEDQFNTNLDYQLTASNRIYGKFFWANNPTVQGLYSFAGTQNALQAPGAPDNLFLKNRVLSLGDIHVFSPSLLNDFKIGGNVITVDSKPQEPFTTAQWGISNPLSSLYAGAPTITIINNIDLNSSPLADNFSQNKTYDVSDMMTWTVGRHTLKFGGEYKRQEVNLTYNAYTRGQVYYANWAAFIAGVPALSIIGTGDPQRAIRANDFSYFIQDDWRVNSRLTINIGLRYDYFGPFTEEKGRFVAFDPSQATTAPLGPGLGVAVTGGYIQAGNGSLPGIPKGPNGLVGSDWNNFGPRFGFAYKLLPNSDMMVLRGGYGIYYDRLNARSFNSQVFNAPYNLVGLNIANVAAGLYLDPANPYIQVPLPSTFPIAFNNTSVFPYGGPPYILPTPFKLGNPFAATTTILPNYVPAPGIFPDVHNFRTPYVQQWNLGIQTEIQKNLLLDIAYVGATGRKLTRLRNVNQTPLPGNAFIGPYSLGLSALATAPLGTFVQSTSAQSIYNSLQMSLTKRYSNGLQFLASYTWSHSIDDFSGGDVNDLVGTVGDTTKNYFASSDFDRRHRFVMSAVYDLPKFFKGKNVFVKGAVNNWEVAGIGTWQSGTPFSILGDYSAFKAVYADLASGRTVSSATKTGDVMGRLNAYFDTTAFVQPSGVGNWGNVGRNNFVGPDQKNLDFSIVKFFPIRENQKFEFRSEFFNITNHTNFANPVNVLSSATFGQILRTSTSPRVIQFAFKYSF